MVRVKESERKRRRAPKSRTGCKTCKIRRLKCDESKPHCYRCTSTGRKCEYDSQVQAPLASILSASGVFTSPREHRSFAFFQERTSYQIAGFYDCEFWNTVVLQAAQALPGIRHAVIALASLHEDFEKTGDADSLADDFALQQYNLAIREHLDSLAGSHSSVDEFDNYLASCMIFICIEMIQGHYASALSLVQGAVNIFYGTHVATRTSSRWPLETFECLLSRLQDQAIGLVGPGAIETTIPPRLKPSTGPDMPKTFQTIGEARAWIDYYSYVHNLSQSADTAQVADAGPLRIYLALLDRWTSAFEALVESLGDNISRRDVQAIAVLRIRRLVFSLTIDMALKYAVLEDDQTLWDNYLDIYDEIVTLAELVNANDESSAHPSHPPSHRFTLDFGTTAPLYDLARLCRHPQIRRRAIAALRQSPCREGMWDGLLAARSAERQMELEESAVPFVKFASDVPRWARFCSATPTFRAGERRAIVEYKRPSAPCEGVGVPDAIVEVIEW